MTTINYLHFHSSGQVTGVGISTDNTVPVDGIQCTSDQAKNWQQYAVDVAKNEIISVPAEQIAADAIAASNATIKQQIVALENCQARAVREAAIGTTGAVARLLALDAQIAKLRGQLK